MVLNRAARLVYNLPPYTPMTPYRIIKLIKPIKLIIKPLLNYRNINMNQLHDSESNKFLFNVLHDVKLANKTNRATAKSIRQ